MVENILEDNMSLLHRNKNIFVALTYRCNAYCKKCMTRYHVNVNNEMDQQMLDHVLDYLKYRDYRGLISVGTGEPLLYERLEYFVTELLGINDDVRLRLLTNGMALNEDTPEIIFDSRCTIGVTFDAFCQHTLNAVQKGVDIEKVKSNVAAAAEKYGGDRFYLNYTLYNNNILEFIPFCKFAIENKIKELYLTELKVYSGYESILDGYKLQRTSELDNILGQAADLLRENGISADGIDINKSHSRSKCYLGNKASPIIDVDGSVTLCSGREDVYVGYIYDENIDEKYEAFLKEIKTKEDWCSFCHNKVLEDGTYRLPETIKRW
ncbi:MAG: radical SAM protein [Oscillospiraceae bacterium]|nr:radical SAM protein [Oscillospiraceae bacterium]